MYHGECDDGSLTVDLWLDEDSWDSNGWMTNFIGITQFVGIALFLSVVFSWMALLHRRVLCLCHTLWIWAIPIDLFIPGVSGSRGDSEDSHKVWYDGQFLIADIAFECIWNPWILVADCGICRVSQDVPAMLSQIGLHRHFTSHVYRLF